METIAYFDCFAGISGDMILGALLDAGLSLSSLTKTLEALPLDGYRIEAWKTKKRGLSGTRARVIVEQDAGKSLHGLEDITRIIAGSGLPEGVKRSVISVFNTLAEAEARVHGTELSQAHFHEVGAVDSIVDITGSLAGLHLLGIDTLYSSALPWNTGTVECRHGTLPLPAPAVVELSKGLPVFPHPVVGEMVTPTGAAVLKTLATGFGGIPAMKVTSTGYGAGERDLEHFPNLLRLVMGTSPAEKETGMVTVLETEIDDMTPVAHGHLFRRMLDEGALDISITPVYMKKNRPGHRLTVISPPHKTDHLASIILSETTTLGIRFRREERFIIDRSIAMIDTPYGEARVKFARRPDGAITATPEYEDCARLSDSSGVPLARVIESVRQHAEDPG